MVEAINHLITQCCSEYGVDFRNIYEAVLVDNTGMHHLLLGVPVRYLTLPPYVPALKSQLNIKAVDIHRFAHRPSRQRISDAAGRGICRIRLFVGRDCNGIVSAEGYLPAGRHRH